MSCLSPLPRPNAPRGIRFGGVGPLLLALEQGRRMNNAMTVVAHSLQEPALDVPVALADSL